MTRMTLGFSKKLENFKAAVALFLGWYNLGRIHGTLGTTPAVAIGRAERPWTLAELVGTGY